MNTTATEGSALLKPAEVGDELRVSKATVYRLIAAGELDTVHVGARKATRVPRESVLAYIAKNGRSAA